MVNIKNLRQDQIDDLIRAYKSIAKSQTNWCEKLNQPCSTYYYDIAEKLKKVKNDT